MPNCKSISPEPPQNSPLSTLPGTKENNQNPWVKPVLGYPWGKNLAQFTLGIKGVESSLIEAGFSGFARGNESNWMFSVFTNIHFISATVIIPFHSSPNSNGHQGLCALRETYATQKPHKYATPPFLPLLVERELFGTYFGVSRVLLLKAI